MAGKTLKEAAAEKLQKVIEVRGIKVEGVTQDALDDFDVLEALAALQDEDAEDSKRLVAMAALGPLVLGGKQWARVKRELREANGGRLTVRDGVEFINGVLEAAGSKN